jgi:hypothetical protein
VAEHLELLARLEQPRGETGVVEEPPEVVPRVREVGRGRRRNPTRVDPAEDDRKVVVEDVRDGAR